MGFRYAVLSAALVTAVVASASARADGLPVLGVSTAAQGVVAPAGDVRYVAMDARGATVVARLQRNGAHVLASTFVRGTFAVPGVAYDGSTAGISHDGRTLVLIRPRLRFPRSETTLAILDAERMRLRKLVTLQGDFSFDAISPRGSALYLIQYTSRTDPTRYRVRVLDLPAGRLLANPVVDPRERGEAMRGSPITRATSPDGRLAYTLYDGVGKHPFVHALDVSRRTARCIDLDMLAGRRDLYALRLGVDADAGTVSVFAARKPVALIDARSFSVSTPALAPARATAAPDGDGPRALLLAVVGGTAALFAGLAVVLRRRRRSFRPEAGATAR